MSFIEWITRRPGFRTLEDSFAVDRESMLVGLERAISQQRKRCDEVWLVAHFFDTFERLQEFLADREIEYSIVESPSCQPVAKNPAEGAEGVLRLVLSALVAEPSLDDLRPDVKSSKRPDLAMIVCERHPFHVYDKRLFEAAKKIEASVTLGYVLSLDDVAVKQIVSPMSMQVLKQLGLDRHELIASHYLSKLLERRLVQNAGKFVSDLDAESAAHWIELNSA